MSCRHPSGKFETATVQLGGGTIAARQFRRKTGIGWPALQSMLFDLRKTARCILPQLGNVLRTGAGIRCQLHAHHQEFVLAQRRQRVRSLQQYHINAGICVGRQDAAARSHAKLFGRGGFDLKRGSGFGFGIRRTNEDKKNHNNNCLPYT